ncbi:MAG: excinuclease ABC subunit UvrC [Francisellaceae bacterium]|nr:excinuclease ABC subunit UvrC [Francisellaceae bacterium]
MDEKPGVYLMKGGDGKVLYVGKAKNIKKRVGSYFQKKPYDNKTQSLISRIEDIEVTVTANETEALLLENSLINQLQPPYNIIFRDDKSYPYVALSNDKFPRMFLHRGQRKKDNKYFGPYPSVRSIRETIEIMQKIFQLRQCEDSYFKNRKKPCLQYQIDRCSAPCVKKIDQKNYSKDVKNSLLFLKGKVRIVIEQLVADMDIAANNKDFERAARIRNQIQSLRVVNQHQRVFHSNNQIDCDVISCSITKEYVCFYLIIIRGGSIIGSRQYLEAFKLEQSADDLFAHFMMQQYMNETGINTSAIPDLIIVPKRINISEGLIEHLNDNLDNSVQLRCSADRVEQDWENMAQNSAQHAIKAKVSQDESYVNKIEDLAQVLELQGMENIVCFDISHLQGTNAVSSCVVFNYKGALKQEYRRFKISSEIAGDDCCSIYETVKKYFDKLVSINVPLPKVAIVDGGIGQVHAAQKALSELAIPTTCVQVLGISKGPNRKPGEERILYKGNEISRESLPVDAPAFMLLQEVRDEAHRFAITGHRKARANYQTNSFLENIAGIGPKKRQDLLKYFGGLQGLMSASVFELAQVPGINETLAKRLFSEICSVNKE